MNGNYQVEQEIDLRRLAGYFLRNIKTIIVVAIIVMLACGTLFSLKSYKSRVKEIETKSKELVKQEAEDLRLEEEKEAQRLRDEQDRTNAANTYEYNHENAIIARDLSQENLDKQQKYMDESYQYHMDPQDVYVSSLWIRADFKNAADLQKENANYQMLTELKNFEFDLKHKSRKEKIADIVGLEGVNRLDYFGEIFSAGVDGSTLILTVSIYTENAKERNEIVDYISETLDEYVPKNNRLSLYIANREDTEGYNKAIFDNKIKQDQTLDNLQSDLDKKNRAILDLETAEAKRIRDIRVADEKQLEADKLAEEEKAAEREKNGTADLSLNIKKIVIKGVLAGIFAGLFVGCGFFGVKYILGGLMHSIDEITGMYGIRKLGTICLSEDADKCQVKNKNYIKLVKWIEGTDCAETKEQSEEIVRINVANHLDGEKTIAIVTSLTGEEIEQVVNLVKNELEANGVNAVNLSFVADKITALREIKNCDKAIIIEEENKTKLKDASFEISQIKDLKKEIIGVVGIA